jgi:hypothetical protein
MAEIDPLGALFDDSRLAAIEEAKDAMDALSNRKIKVGDMDVFVGAGPITGHGYLVYDFETVPDELAHPKPEIEVSDEQPDLTWFATAKLTEIDKKLESVAWSDAALDAIRASESAAPKPRKGLLESVDKIKATRANLVAEWSKACSTNPFRCKIVSFAWAEGEEDPRVMLAQNEAEEVALLHQWWKLAACRRKRVGYNILGYDEMVVAARSRKLKVEPTCKLNRSKFSNRQIVDLMNVIFPAYGAKPCKEVCDDMGIKIPVPGVDGSQVYDLIQQGKWDEVAAYNVSDVLVERELLHFCLDTFEV